MDTGSRFSVYACTERKTRSSTVAPCIKGTEKEREREREREGEGEGRPCDIIIIYTICEMLLRFLYSRKIDLRLRRSLSSARYVIPGIDRCS